MRDGEPLHVGDLSARRDFVDVRDAVGAFDKLLTEGRPGAAYNIASGTSVAIRTILAELVDMSGLHDVHVQEECARIRQNDVPDVYGDIAAIVRDVGWQPRISLGESLTAMWNATQCKS